MASASHKLCLPHTAVGLAVAGLMLLTAGCQENQEIRRYQVPRLENEQISWRLLGAMVPREDKVWFFRLEGPAKRIDTHKDEFERFVQSVRFHDNDPKQPISWKLPEGWRQSPEEKAMRFATILVEPNKEASPELTVIPLPNEGDADSVVKNVNRWRDQLGLPPLRESRLDQVARTVKAADKVEVTVVDLTGTKLPKARPMVAMGGKAPPAPKPRRNIMYVTPKGWKEQAGGGIRAASFIVGEGDNKAEVTVIPLPGKAGTVLSNVNRWRDQVKLGPIDEVELAKTMQTVAVDGTPAQYVDVAGPQLRILGVMLSHGTNTWFIKMTGPVRLVGEQKSAFEDFVRSVKFEG